MSVAGPKVAGAGAGRAGEPWSCHAFASVPDDPLSDGNISRPARSRGAGVAAVATPRLSGARAVGGGYARARRNARSGCARVAVDPSAAGDRGTAGALWHSAPGRRSE